MHTLREKGQPEKATSCVISAARHSRNNKTPELTKASDCRVGGGGDREEDHRRFLGQ